MIPNIKNVKLGTLQIAKVMKGDMIVWENWKVVTGKINIPECSVYNKWSSGRTLDLGKEIIPLEGTIYFHWHMVNGKWSTGCGAGLGGWLKNDGGEHIQSYELTRHSVYSIGKDGNDGWTETWKTPDNKRPIRYVNAFCGGGSGGEEHGNSSTHYRSSGTITKWLEKGN